MLIDLNYFNELFVIKCIVDCIIRDELLINAISEAEHLVCMIVKVRINDGSLLDLQLGRVVSKFTWFDLMVNLYFQIGLGRMF